MARSAFWTLAVLSAQTLVSAQDEKYISDLELYSLLPPCARSALYVNVDRQSSSCEPGQLQSCACSNTDNYKSVSTAISESLYYNCESTATEEFSSAYVVYSQYCTPDKTYTLPTPTENLVTQLVTDIPEFFAMPGCLQNAMSYAFGSMSYYCPETASLFAPCACSHNSNLARLSSHVRSDASYGCSGNREDMTYAQRFLTAYCAMNDGTTDLPRPSPPPGDMPYYVTALAQYSSLPECAQSGVSQGLSESFYCGEGPRAMASCICIKSGMYERFSSTMTASVKGWCSSTAIP